jgi:hypothetical protein
VTFSVKSIAPIYKLLGAVERGAHWVYSASHVWPVVRGARVRLSA